MATAGRSLVHPSIDGWLLGGVAVVAWLAFSPLDGGSAPVDISGPVGAVFLALGAAHFGSTYHLAYGLPAEVRRRHRWALVWVPAAIVAVSLAILAAHRSGADRAVGGALRWLFILIFSLTGWHYIKQAYGVGLLAGRARGIKPSRREALTLRYALYPVWAVTLGRIWIEGAGSTYRNIDVTVDALPPVTGTVLRAVAVASLLLAAGTMLRVAARAGTLPPFGMWSTYLAGGLWLLYSPGVVGASVVGAGLHGLQYLACVHRAEVDWARERGETQIATLWLSLIGGALAGGLLMSAWLPSFLDGTFAGASTPGLYGSLIFIALNLHHYAIDAAIWRHDGPHLVRVSKGPQVAGAGAEPATATPVAAAAQPVTA